VEFVEASTKVSGGGGIGNSFGVQSVQIGFILAPPFDVLQSFAVTENVVGQIEHVVRFAVRVVELLPDCGP
jgi:hypothetical protein